ncbi:oxysterol-binding protein-related protein 9-like isoform X1 [Dermacentor albipictus]|uniref:oxysterol-binding protein-related protein 9-like isoform X1 n=1 Tax=Dermacentor albipictus TaxID=60249 RepID=UPI0031FCA41A
MEGPLSVWTSSISGWHLCWVVLDDRNGMLYRFKSHHQRRKRMGLLAKFGGINLLGAIVTKDPREPNGFSVVSEGREYRFQAPSEDERDAWVMGLEEAVLRQMVCRRAYHIWDRRYIGPTLALVNAKLQDAGLLYEELACSLQELDRRWSTEEAGQRTRWPGVIRDLLAFLTTARATMALLEKLKEMILPGLLAQLDTMQPRKKAATMLSLLRTQAAGLALDPLSVLLRRNPEPTVEGSALLEPAIRGSRTRLHHPLSEMAHTDPSGYASRLDALGRRSPAGRRSPSTSERTGTRSLPPVRSPRSGSGQQLASADDSSFVSVSESVTWSQARFTTAVSSIERSDVHADNKSSRSMMTTATAQSKRPSQNSSDSSESSETEPSSSSSVSSADHRWQVDTLVGRGQAPENRPPSKHHTRTPPLSLMLGTSRIWEETLGPTARTLGDLCSSLPFGESLLHLDYPMPLLQARSCLQALADLFACPELFAEIGSSTRASERMLRALRWYLAGIHYVKRGDDITKPLEPVLGETHRCTWPLRCGQSMGDLQYDAEQVSVNPPQTCLYAECTSNGIRALAQLRPEAFSVGSYVQIRLHGKVSVYVSQYSEEYLFELPAACVRNISGKPWFEFCGVVNVSCRQTGYRAKMKFMAKAPMPSSQRHNIQVDVYNPVLNRPFVRLHGRWTDGVTASWASGETKEILNARLLKQARREPTFITEDNPKCSTIVWRTVTDVLRRKKLQEAYDRRLNVLKSTEPNYQPMLFKKEGDTFSYKNDLKRKSEKKLQ